MCVTWGDSFRVPCSVCRDPKPLDEYTNTFRPLCSDCRKTWAGRLFLAREWIARKIGRARYETAFALTRLALRIWAPGVTWAMRPEFKGRRIRTLYICPIDISNETSAGERSFEVERNTVPADAKIVYCDQQGSPGSASLYIESEQFSPSDSNHPRLIPDDYWKAILISKGLPVE